MFSCAQCLITNKLIRIYASKSTSVFVTDSRDQDLTGMTAKFHYIVFPTELHSISRILT